MNSVPFLLDNEFQGNATLPSLSAQSAKVVEFDPNWCPATVEVALPLNVGDWILANLNPGEEAAGARWAGGRFAPFRLQRGDSSKRQHAFMATFELLGGLQWLILPGKAMLMDKGRRRRLEIWVQYRDAGGELYWRQDMYVKSHFLQAYTDCPLDLMEALTQVDQMFWRLTHDDKRKPSTMLSTILTVRFVGDHPMHGESDEVTPAEDFNVRHKQSGEEMIRAYHYLSAVYHQYAPRGVRTLQASLPYALLFEEVRKAALYADYQPYTDFSATSPIWETELAKKIQNSEDYNKHLDTFINSVHSPAFTQMTNEQRILDSKL